MTTNNQLIGYSKKINDPAFSKYLQSTSKWSMYFSFGLALIVTIGFFYYGATSREMDNPEALFIGLGIGGMFILIATIQNMKRKKSKTWDGTVIDKTIEKKKRKTTTDNENYRFKVYDLYTVTIKSNHGKKYTITAQDDDTLYNYYRIGDKVRRHAGLNTYEKYDKSKDTIIFCNACSTLNKIEDDYCFRCKCPLLK
jgi:hypothetical protein